MENYDNFRALAENANDGILIATGEGKHVYANKRAAEITGLTVPEILKARMQDLAHPDELEKIKTRLRERLEGQPVPRSYETAVLRKDGKKVPVEITGAKTSWEGQPADIVIVRDITEHKHKEEELEALVEKRTTELRNRTQELEEANAALKVLLKRRDEDRTELEEKVVANVTELIKPYIAKLKQGRLDGKQTACVGIIESNLRDIVSPLARKLSSKLFSLTPKELRVANLVKGERTTKEIATLMDISTKTVEYHRDNIRKKLGIKNEKVNLRSHLLSLQ